MDHRQYESLNPGEQARVFRGSALRDRADLLLHSSQPLQLTQSLSPEEFYLTVREMDPDERSDVIGYATMPQLVFLSDIACWDKDQISVDGLLSWLEMLAKADEEQLIRWFDEMDYEMIIAGFKKLIHVLKPEWEYPSDELL